MALQVSDFLEEKWRRAFRFYDRNNDGVITSEDFEMIAEYISKKTGANEEEASKTRHEFVKWHGLIQPDPSKVLDLEAFVNGGRELFKDLNNLIQLNSTMASDFFDRMDLDKDGKISFQELSIFYEAVGYTDKNLIESTFRHLDKNQDGFIEREELVDDYVRYFTNPDPVEGKAYIIPPVLL